MLFSSKPPSAKTDQDSFIFDVGTAEFETRVLEASNQKPILIDFWAPWCGPCKQLGPMLEKLVTEANGAVLMAKVNIDDNPDLAQAFQVQSIPTVMAIYQGRPVTGFQGVQPESTLKQLIAQLSQLADGGESPSGSGAEFDAEAVLKAGDDALHVDDYANAQNAYGHILSMDPEHGAAYAGMIRTFIRSGHPDQAQSLVDHAPDSLMNDKDVIAAKAALQLAKEAPQGDIEEMAKAAGKDDAAPEDRFTYAQALFGRGRSLESFDVLLDLIRDHKDWEDEKARTMLLSYFDALGATHPDTLAARKKLSRLLFS